MLNEFTANDLFMTCDDWTKDERVKLANETTTRLHGDKGYNWKRREDEGVFLKEKKLSAAIEMPCVLSKYSCMDERVMNVNTLTHFVCNGPERMNASTRRVCDETAGSINRIVFKF